jgi:hypothetical protein
MLAFYYVRFSAGYHLCFYSHYCSSNHRKSVIFVMLVVAGQCLHPKPLRWWPELASIAAMGLHSMHNFASTELWQPANDKNRVCIQLTDKYHTLLLCNASHHMSCCRKHQQRGSTQPTVSVHGHSSFPHKTAPLANWVTRLTLSHTCTITIATLAPPFR